MDKMTQALNEIVKIKGKYRYFYLYEHKGKQILCRITFIPDFSTYSNRMFHKYDLSIKKWYGYKSICHTYHNTHEKYGGSFESVKKYLERELESLLSEKQTPPKNTVHPFFKDELLITEK